MAGQDDIDDIMRALAAASDGAIGGVAPPDGLLVAASNLGPQLPGLFLPQPGLQVPGRTGKAPIDYVGVYMVLSDYLTGDGTGLSNEQLRDGLITLFASLGPPSRLLEVLIMVDRALGSEALRDNVLADHRRWLSPAACARYDHAAGSMGRVPLAHQPVYAAMAHVMSLDGSQPAGPDLNPGYLALPFVHAIAEGLASGTTGTPGPALAGFPAILAMEMVCNAAFNERGDTYTEIARHGRLWHDYASAGSQYLDGRTPAELARAAIGLAVEDFLALGFALTAYAMAWEPGRGLYVDADLGSDADPAVIEKFVNLVSATPPEMRQALAGRRSRWDFLALQRQPVVRAEHGLLVLDAGLMFRRVTEGLFWDVHDHLAATEGDRGRIQWTQKWGAIVEAMIEDELAVHIPWMPFDPKLTWDENDLAAAYGDGKKRCDLVLDLGDALLAADVVSGQLTMATRIDGDVEAFEKDLEKLVYKKVRQLHDTCISLVDNETLLTGVAPSRPRPIYPVVAIGSDFARHPIITNTIEEYSQREGLLRHPRIAPLSVLDVSEIEALEGLAAHGHSLIKVLDDWHRSGIAAMSLRNYLIDTLPAKPDTFRSPRTRASVDAWFDRLLERLRLRQGPEAPTA